jgi:hypothetical protein
MKHKIVFPKIDGYKIVTQIFMWFEVFHVNQQLNIEKKEQNFYCKIYANWKYFVYEFPEEFP